MAALVKCKACGASISTAAKTCPQCGQPAPKRTSVLVWVLVGVIGVSVVGAVMNRVDRGAVAPETPQAAIPAKAAAPKNPQRDAQLQLAGLGAMTLKKASKDPESFEMKSVLVMPSGAACYEYRAKNSFNAMLAGSAIMTTKKKLLVHERDGSAFVSAWNAECTKEGGDELLPLLKRLDII